MWPIIGVEPDIAKALYSACGYLRQTRKPGHEMPPHIFVVYDDAVEGPAVAIGEVRSSDIQVRVAAMRKMIQQAGQQNVRLLLHAFEAWTHTTDQAVQLLRSGDATPQPGKGRYLRLDSVSLMCWRPGSVIPVAALWMIVEDTGELGDLYAALPPGGNLTADPAYATLWK